MSILQTISIDILVSAILCALLIGVILLALRLDRKLTALRDNSGELSMLITGLNDATERAHQAVAHLSAAAREHKGKLETSITKARDLSDELNLITQSADSLASRLSQSATSTAPKPIQTDVASAVDPADFPRRERAEMSEISDNQAAALKKIIAGVR
ncbi:MAG: DUF6468 domain-containing protein [Pseudomonadota bacterium]